MTDTESSMAAEYVGRHRAPDRAEAADEPTVELQAIAAEPGTADWFAQNPTGAWFAQDQDQTGGWFG